MNPNRHFINGNNLEVKNVQPEDRGYFECQADDETDSARDYVRVDVEEREAPKIEIYPMEKEIPLEIGSVAYAQCRIAAGMHIIIVIYFILFYLFFIENISKTKISKRLLLSQPIVI